MSDVGSCRSAVAVSAVAALVDSFLLLYFRMGRVALGMFSGIAGFANLGFRP